MEPQHRYDLAIIGAGPAGLEMALAAAELGLDFVVLERGRVAENIRQWGFVRLFSPWRMNVSPRGLVAAGLVRTTGESSLQRRADAPAADATLPGRDYVRLYLEPIAKSAALAGRIEEHVNVVRVGRSGSFKNTLIGDPRRADLPFTILAERRDDRGPIQEIELGASHVIDASGVYGHHRWLGDGGIPCPGERSHGDRISYLLEDIGQQGDRLHHKHVALVGAGYSACTLLEAFARLRGETIDVRVSWILNRSTGETGIAAAPPIHVLPDDPLPYRERLGRMANQLVSEANGWLDIYDGHGICAVEEIRNPDSTGERPGRLHLRLRRAGGEEEEAIDVDHIYAMVGYAPDRSLYEELQFHECWATSGPMKLAASLLAQSGADCLTIESGGPETLLNPEPGFFVIGAKSYGRNSQFLIERLPDQVDAVAGLLASGSRRD